MKKFTKNQGITLIALIITIIVMLILVAVTINVALNGGLFTRAKEAAFKTEIQQIQEQISLKKAEQAADNEINGTTGYNITLDNIGISTELKNKYRNKLSVSSTGDLQYDPDNCTAEEIAYLTSIGAKSGTASTSNKLEFDMKSLAGDNVPSYIKIAKQVFDDGVYSYYLEATIDGDEIAANMYSGTYTYTTETANYKIGKITVTKEYDLDEGDEVAIPANEQEDYEFIIYTLKEDGQIINNVFLPMESGIIPASTNGTAGISIPDSNLIGTYYDENNNDSITIGISQDENYGTIQVGSSSSKDDILILKNEDTDILYVIFEALCPIVKDSEKITITYNDVEFSKANS